MLLRERTVERNLCVAARSTYNVLPAQDRTLSTVLQSRLISDVMDLSSDVTAPVEHNSCIGEAVAIGSKIPECCFTGQTVPIIVLNDDTLLDPNGSLSNGQVTTADCETAHLHSSKAVMPHTDRAASVGVMSQLDDLKAMTLRLNLRTRRGSYVEWRRTYLEGSATDSTTLMPGVKGEDATGLDQDDWSADRVTAIHNSLLRIRKDLVRSGTYL